MSGKTNTYRLGIEAELLVARHFESLDFSIVSQRYKTKFGEIDLIVSKDNQLIFVEVKARSKIIPLDDLITQKQTDRNYRAAEFFLSEFSKYSAYDCRFDVFMVCQGRILHHIKVEL